MTEPPDHVLRGPALNVESPPRGGMQHEREARISTAHAGRALRPTVFFFCRLGDMVMLTALLRRLHARYQLPCNVIGAGSWNTAVYQGNPDVAGLWSFGRHVPFLLDPSWLAVRRALRAAAPGPIYICEDHYRQLPRIRRMLALSGVDPARCVFVTDEKGGGPEHLIDKLMRLGSRTPTVLRAADYPVPPAAEDDGPRLYLSDRERAERDAWLRSQGWAGHDLILLQPGNHRSMSRRRSRWRRTGADDKAWPLERWVELLQLMHQRMRHARIVLRGSREEVPMLREIQAATQLDAVGVAGDTLREFFALCEAAHSMVSVDTGPAHAAAALGLPLVVLYGAHSPQHWLPRSPSRSPVLGVRGPPPATRVDQVPVSAVFDAWCSLIPQTRSANERSPAPQRLRAVGRAIASQSGVRD
ncbi:MAG TPA: glycosyltransferase family 9 protein [Steroidobacteraceae bacterium]|jgi:ADP-heptose:LPS heptosyltransferase|nr:glycosyltransferase family 9 protein [Steroidobacteraceae bacterium]